MTWEVRQGDCRALMADHEPASIDAIVTDPPYGLGFMGKEWDHGVPGVPFWVEALRVLKPGGHLVAFGGTRTYHRLTCAIEDAGFEVRDCLMWLYGSGFPKSHNGTWGGTALKPAWEPIILARKPLSGTVAANVQEHGTGALNVDGCRIGTAKMGGYEVAAGGMLQPSTQRLQGYRPKWERDDHPFTAKEAIGRWPANLVLDEEAALGLGAEARYFYTAKASSGERHYAGKNAHPTVKPVELMRWLCRLVTPKGGLVLDPFMGSGSTGVAALAEGFPFLGFELDPEHCRVARQRIAGPLFAQENPLTETEVAVK